MSIPVRQSTAFETKIGPILDADGVAVTGGVVGDFKIKKTTGDSAALNGSATLTHTSAGFYDLVLTTSDTDTVGLCVVHIDDTTNTCASLYLQVMEEVIYDALYAASANAYAGAAGSTTLGSGAITATVIATGAIDADAIADNAIDAGAIAADAISATKIATGAITSAKFAAGAIDAAAIANAAIDAATFAADVDAEILSYLVDDATRIDASALNTLSGHDPGATIGTSTLTQTQVTGGAYALNSASFAFNAALDFTTTQKAATLARVTLVDTVTTYTGNTPQTGDAYAIVNSGTHGNAALKTLIEDVPTTAEFEARTLVAASYGTAANQVTIAGYIDTEVAAIKAKTDQLTFTVANTLDVNIEYVNGTQIDGAGTTLDPWGPV